MANRGRPRHPDILTPREWEVLELLRSGASNAQIAERLGVTERTAKFHVSEILSKLGVASREEAASLPIPEHRRWWNRKLLWIGGAAAAATATAVIFLVASSAITTSKESTQFLGTMEPLGPDQVGNYDDPHDFKAFAKELGRATEQGNVQWFMDNTTFEDYKCYPDDPHVPPPRPPDSCPDENPNDVVVPAIRIVAIDWEGDDVDAEEYGFGARMGVVADHKQYSDFIRRSLTEYKTDYADRYGGGKTQLHAYGRHGPEYASGGDGMTAIVGGINELSARGNEVDNARRVVLDFDAVYEGGRWTIGTVWYESDQRFVVVDLDAGSAQAKKEMGQTVVWQFWQRLQAVPNQQ